MQLIHGLHNLKLLPEGCVATIGNFDGIHVGHQAIFQQLMQAARQLQLPAMVVTFEPHPREFFDKDAPARLTRLREKLLLLRQLQIPQVLCLQFNQKLAQLTPDKFVQSVLLAKLRVKHLMVGEDFRFGCNRQGDFQQLQAFGQQYQFTVATCSTVLNDGKKVSSTRVRQALLQGDLAQVTHLLSRPYSMCGRVVYGDQRGRQLGVPTANILLHRKISPLNGVFVVQVAGLGETYNGVANIGTRPTVSGTRSVLEVHLFNFDRDIYGHYIEVKFLHKLRDEQRFASLELLKQQIMQDIAQAKNYFNY